MVEEEQKPEDVKKESRADFLKEAREIAERNEAAVKKMEELTSRNEEIAARGLLGGRTDTGSKPEPPKEITPEEYAKNALAGKLNEVRTQ